MAVQVPTEPPTVQLSHVPPQGRSQQTPDEQLSPAWQSLLSRQDCPRLAWPHLPPMHLLGAWHWGTAPSPAQAPWQLAPSGLQVYGAQVKAAPGMQAPAPLQLEASVLVPSAHRWGAQMVVGPYLRQAPAPLQVPSFPQLTEPSSRQVPVGSWPPSETAVQVPATPGRLQDWQLPSQRLAQQTPWAQNPLEQSVSWAQRLPIDCLPQELPTQALGAAHSALVTQKVPQRLPAQVKGVHDCPSGTAQAPLRQTPGAVHSLRPALQLCWRQVVPLA
jgi:hypothetical protein